jgi:CSLREA domain-containing protein
MKLTSILHRNSTTVKIYVTCLTAIVSLLVAGGVFAHWRVNAAAVNSGSLIYLQDAQKLSAAYNGSSGATSPLNAGQAQPLSLAAADFNEDGVDDVVVGYGAQAGSGVLAVHTGNLDAFAPQTQTSWQSISLGQFPSPFSSTANAIQISATPDFVVTGKFAGTEHADIVTTTRNGTSLLLLAGNGHSQFASPKTTALPAGVTAMAAGKFGSQLNYGSLLVAVGGTSPTLLLYSGSSNGLTLTSSFVLPAAASTISLGDMDGDLLPDALLVCGNKIVILHAAASVVPRLETVSLPALAQSAIAGTFIHDRAWRQQIAVLATDGSVYIVAHGNFNPAGWTRAEIQAMWQAKKHHSPNPLARPTTPTLDGWQIAESFSAAAPFISHPPLMYAARISAQGTQDIMLMNADAGNMVMISHPNVKPGAAGFVPGQLASRPYSAGVPVAGLPLRVNVDARAGMVMLHQNQVGVSAMMPLPDPTFVVNTTNDTVDIHPGDGVCADINGQCSLRAAVMEANANMNGADPTNPANTQDTIVLPSGTFRLTIPPAGTFDASTGHLDINDSLSIVGAGPASTIIQAANGDQVFSILDLTPANAPDPTLQGPGITASISNLTISGGQASTVDFFNLGGGGIVWDAGTEGIGTLNLTSVVISGNTSTAVGGGLALSDFGLNPDSSVVISNSVIQGNSSLTAGGGISTNGALTLTVSNSQITNNQAVDPNPADGSPEQGGGLLLFSSNPTATQIHSSTISGNTAGAAGVGQGGGVWTSQALVIDQGTIISNNQAGADGGGVWSALVNPGDSVTVTASTISANQSGGNGGGVQVDVSNAGSFAVLFSRIVNNTSVVGGDGLNNASTVAVTADDNWWGCNAGPTVLTSPCDHVQGATPASLVTLSLASNPSTLLVSSTSQLTASFQDGNPAFSGNLNAFIGIPVSFQNAMNGALSNAQLATQTIASATATFTATGLGTGSAQAVADQQTLTTSLTVSDFGIAATPALQSVTARLANSVTYNGSVSSLNGFSGAVTVSCSVSPAGAGVTAACPASVNVVSGQVTAFSFSVANTATTPSGTYVIAVNGTNGGQTRTSSVSLAVADFTITAAQTTLTTNAGTAATFTDSLTLISPTGLSGPVTVTCSAPVGSGVTASCAPTSLNLPANVSAVSTLTISASATVVAGNYSISVTATAPGVSRTVTVNLVLASFTLAITPANQSITAGGSATFTITATTTTGFNLNVPLALSCSAPVGAGLTTSCPATFSVSPLVGPNGTATASMTVSSNTTASAASNVAVAMSSGAFSANAATALTVANFSVTASSASQIVNAGAAGSRTYTLTLTSAGGFSGTVSLNCGAPAGSPISGSCSPSSVVVSAAGSATSTLTLSNAATTASGSYAVPVTASSGGISHAITTTLVVADFALSAQPPALTANAGATTAPVTITGTTTSGFNGTVTFSPSDVTGLPAGATVAFSTTSITVAADSTTNITGLTVNVPATASPGTYALTIVGRSGNAARSAPVSLVVSGFSVAISAPGQSITMQAGSTATFNLSAQSLSGFAGTVNLLATISVTTGTSNAPPSVSVAPSITLTAGGHTTFTVTIPTSLFDVPATYGITVTGTSGAIVQTVTLTLVLTPPPPTFVLFPLTSSPIKSHGSLVDMPVFADPVGGFNSILTATATEISGPSLPPGILFGWCTSCSQINGPIPPTYVQTIQVQPGSGVGLGFSLVNAPAPGPTIPLGIYVFRLTVTGGGITQTVDWTVNIVPITGYTMTTNPVTGSNTTISQGQSATYTVTLSNFQNIPAGTVLNLSATNLVSFGAQYSFSPPSLSAPGTSTMTVTTNGSTEPGNIVFAIVASDGTVDLTQGVEQFLTVKPSPPLTISPTVQSVDPGGSANYTVTPLAVNGCAYVTGISVSVAGLPSGASISGAPGTAWGSTILTISTSTATPDGNYPLTITGNACQGPVTAAATLNVNTPFDPGGGSGCGVGANGRPLPCLYSPPLTM